MEGGDPLPAASLDTVPEATGRGVRRENRRSVERSGR